MEAFWIVWEPSSKAPPCFRHSSGESARKEAERLARYNPGKQFFALRAYTVSSKSDVSTIPLTCRDDSEVPF